MHLINYYRKCLDVCLSWFLFPFVPTLVPLPVPGLHIPVDWLSPQHSSTSVQSLSLNFSSSEQGKHFNSSSNLVLIENGWLAAKFVFYPVMILMLYSYSQGEDLWGALVSAWVHHAPSPVEGSAVWYGMMYVCIENPAAVLRQIKISQRRGSFS